LDSYEIYEPPYFFQGERPVISSSPASTAWGRTISVGTSNTDIARAVLVSPSGTTHAVDMAQRVVNLPARKRADGAGYDIDMPLNANIALPGHHTLFLIDSQGRPSHAQWIELTASALLQAEPIGGCNEPQPTPTPAPKTSTTTAPSDTTAGPSKTDRPSTGKTDTRKPRATACLRTRSVGRVHREKRVRLGLALDEGGRVRFEATLSRGRLGASGGRVTLATWTRSIRFTRTGTKEARLVLSDHAVRRLRGAVNARLSIRAHGDGLERQPQLADRALAAEALSEARSAAGRRTLASGRRRRPWKRGKGRRGDVGASR
jgi:hypothetical protein